MRWLERFKTWLDGRRAGAPPRTAARPAARAAAAHPEEHALVLQLALQGGGAHGAFTWGVLDRLLDEADFSCPRISGTSAGALNGAVLVSGYAAGGRAGAQRALAELWEAVSEIGALFAPLQAQRAFLAKGFGAGFDAFDAFMRLWSPAQLNPFDLNPLRDVLERQVNLDALRHCPDIRLHVCATNVTTGEPRVFSGEDLSIAALLASACLPFLFRAVEIDGVPYWDGGYAGNPVLAPLIDGASRDDGRDVLLIQINPQARVGAPTTASDIMHRVNEITFNASLLAELRAIELLGERIESARPAIRLHRIGMHDGATQAEPAGKASVNSSFFHSLRDQGRTAAAAWLAAHRLAVGRVGTMKQQA